MPATGVAAVALNVTVTEPTAPSFLTAWPAGETRPLASNLNYETGVTVPNMVVVKVGAGGKVNLFNSSGSVHVIADVAGYYRPYLPTPGAAYTPLPPQRLLDTRSGNGAPAGRVEAGATVILQVTGRGGVPATGVSAVVLNVTVTQADAISFLTVYPSAEVRPLASNLNWRRRRHRRQPRRRQSRRRREGEPLQQLRVGGRHRRRGRVVRSRRHHADRDLHRARPGAHPRHPRRQRRPASAKLGAGGTLRLQVTGRGGIPAGAVGAVVLNVTVTEPTAVSYLTAWPGGTARPLASNLNYVPNQTVPNLVVVQVGAGGTVDLFNNAGSAHVIADVAGWYGS